ncbi:TonB-dependent receptor domain-containing protein [Qipengyuania marisflavi]|uniref:TonB-dependent receptor n=1 Tax=Qipengyuania marisflavi TaxID=2486356 RepID=A0A5S3P6A8_9SPHN|nr:TonB-dependent receptor [Qipengyuania marisflavi]TMM48743.1 TonB-dependent receptor [Qipengyuania marisflavi]
MKTFHENTIKGLAVSVSALALVAGAPAWAQTSQPSGVTSNETQTIDCDDYVNAPDGTVIPVECDNAPVDVTGTGADGSVTPGSIVVTGSRIKRDTYSSISPLQVITTEASNEQGLFDPSQILQRSESASGQQIDATFQGFVLNNGPGSQTLNLRGLGADRTLLLVNGRRLAPSGTEGAPVNPSINLLPGSLIDRYDLLLDGASSVYGSDAVAGVGNVILRKDFDGLELYARGEINPQGGGDDYTVSAAFGKNFDRGFIGIGAEYDFRDTVRFNDRDFFRGCDKNYEVDQDGNIYTLGVRDNAVVLNASGGAVGVSENECKIGGISGRLFNPYTFSGSIYYQGDNGLAFPGFVPGYSDSQNAFGQQIDFNGDGIRDVDFQNVNTNGSNLDQVFQSQQKLYNIMAYGEYTFPSEVNLTPFFEANYSRAEIFADNAGTPQIFPSVPDLNAFNPCNFATNPNGVDCRLADNAINNFPIYSPTGGFNGSSFSGINLPVLPIVSVRGDRNNTDVVQEQYRGVIGVRGDLPFIDPSWTFEVSGVYSRSEGTSVRRGIREDKLAFALGIDPTGDFNGDGIVDNDTDANGDGIPDNPGDGIADDYDSDYDVFGAFGDPLFIGACNGAGLANPDLAASDLLQGCVPVNLFAPSLLTGAIGDFASQAERDYVFGVRSFDTTYEQMIGNAFITGDLFDLQGGPAGAVLGVEIRKDRIDSQPNDVASNGLFFGFFRDRGAVGSKVTKEIFAELDLPLTADKPWVRELSLNVSGRLTDDEIYGTNYTYSLKAGWRPVDPLLLKFSYGTSFRAPNLRENFLLGQSGFLTLFDPCAVPANAYFPLAGGYDPTQDERDPQVLAACRREGRDPTTVGTNGVTTIQSTSIEVETQGSLDIDPETSRSLTAGFAFEETLGDGFDVALGASYFDIKVKNAIVELSSQFAINDCFTRSDGQRSTFCDVLTYGATAGSRQLITDVTPIFLNQDAESVRGIDFSANFGKEVTFGNTLVDFGLNLRANHLIERSSLFVGDDGQPIRSDVTGEFGFPKWTGRAAFTADVDKFRFTWTTRYIGAVEQNEDGIDAFSDAFGNGPDGNPTGFFSDTCLGGGSANGVVPGDGRYCRDVGFAKEQFLHTASIRYRADTFTIIAGVDNIFNTAPPLVDSSEVLAIANTAIGNGYDYDGREFFLSVEKKF